MKNQIVYPPKIDFPIPDDFYNLLFQKLGSCDSELLPWITISLLHTSYLNEQGNKFILRKNVLDILDSLGASFAELVLFDIAHSDKNLNKMIDYSTFVTNAKSQILEAVFEEFDLVKIVLIGKGEKENLSGKAKQIIGRQFCGAIIICYGYDVLKLVISQQTKKIDSITENRDYKTLLQEYSQSKRMGTPKYDLIREFGFDHQKKFLVQVSTVNGKSAQAEGNSKREGQKNAALEYIRHFVPTLLRSKENRPKINTEIPQNFPIPLHKNFVESICMLFNVSIEKAWVLSQSLTHVSFVNETTIRQVIDNRKHAQLGAKVLDALLTQQISYLALDNLNIEEITIEQYRSLLSGEEFSGEGFDLLNLKNGVLLSAGEKKVFHKVISTKAEFFQAVIGAVFKIHGSWEGFIKNIPESLENWFTNKLHVLQKIDSVGDIAPVTGLQILLQAIRLRADFKYKVGGLDHQKEFKPQLVLQSDATSETFILRSDKSSSSRKLATRHIASVALRAINIVNSELGTDTKNLYEDSEELVQFSRFLLFHELSARPNRSDRLRWRKLGILGSQLLMQGKTDEFKLWVIAAGNIVQNKNVASNALAFYSSIPQVSEHDQNEYKSAIIAVGSFVEKLSPEIENADIRLSDEFDKIIKLSKVYNLLSQKWGVVTPQQLVDDLLLLRRGRFPELKFESSIPDILISEKEGTYQTILLFMLELAEKFSPESEKDVLSILIEFETKKSELNISFSFNEPYIPYQEIFLQLNSDILWKYLYREASLSKIHIDARKISVTAKVLSPDNTFASQALRAYKTQNLLAKTENQISSQLLHDLKNQLIAYQVSLDMVGKDRTSTLKSRFEASQHLDSALAICRSLEIVSNSMLSPKIQAIAIGDFIRQYIAEKLTTFPLNIRLETPKSTGNNIIYTSRNFLESILENLTKNAVEAMPDGGEIRMDWLYDEVGELLLIDISDTGPGLQSEMIDRIKLGKIIDSSKHKGSGIGILSVQSMVERLGGKCTVSSDFGKGTQWNITIPSLSPKDLGEIDETDELLANPPDNALEL